MSDLTPSRTPDPEATPKTRRSRRSFLRRSMATAALAGPASLAAGTAAQAAAPTKLTGLAGTLIREIRVDEAKHVPILQGLLDDEDNPLPVKIRQPPHFNTKRLTQPTLTAFLQTAAGFENTGSGFYGGALINITQTQEYFPTAVGLCTVEARHASWLNSMLSEPLVPDFAPVESPIPQGIVLARVGEFVLDHRSTFPSFDTTVVSDANNFAILDFLLFLEYIEAMFYALNVPRYT